MIGNGISRQNTIRIQNSQIYQTNDGEIQKKKTEPKLYKIKLETRQRKSMSSE